MMGWLFVGNRINGPGVRQLLLLLSDRPLVWNSFEILWVFFHNSDAITHLLLCNLLEFLFQTAGSCFLLPLVAVDLLPFVDVVNVYVCS